MLETEDRIKAEIRQRFVELALSPSAEQKFPVGPASAKKLGYVAAEIEALPASVTESFAGVGNPLVLGEVRAGDTVLDLGCGAGLDSILAARRVGPAGKVIGVDFAAKMGRRPGGMPRQSRWRTPSFGKATPTPCLWRTLPWIS
jgi:hypothetical protein